MKNAKIGIGAALAVLALIFTAAVRMVDAAPVGPAGTSVGFSHVNLAVHEALGVHMAWYTLTQLLGMGALLVAFLFAVTGLIQLIRRRSLWKVDRELLALGCLYAAVFALYVLFEIVVINYRPVIMPGETYPEASFPSSHTMLACVILGSTIFMLKKSVMMKKYIQSEQPRSALSILCAAVLVVIVCGRLYSGVHWFTDILGGLLFSAALLMLFKGAVEEIHTKEGDR